MKRIKSFLTIMMAAIFALSLVPTGAWAAADSGDMESTTASENLQLNQGTITLFNTKKGETYNVYRMFELASFRDSNVATEQHPDPSMVSGNSTGADYEAYSYVIRQYLDAGKQKENPWWTFLTTYGPKGPRTGGGDASTGNPAYAVMSANCLDNGTFSETLAENSGAYFVIESQPVSLSPDSVGLTKPASFANADTYHVIRAVKANFDNAWDAIDSTSSRADDGVNATDNQDYSNVNASGKNLNKVQDFAQAAIDFAEANSDCKPNYIEYGLGTNAEHDAAAADASVTVDGGESYADGTDRDGNGTVPLGYYLVGTSMGTLVALDTTNREVNIYEKNDEPTIEKKVLKKASAAGGLTVEDLTGKNTGEAAAWVDDTDADINDLVQFRTVITAQQGADSYVLHDVMERGLDFIPTSGTVTTGYATDRYTGLANDYTYEPRVYLVKSDNSVYQIDETNTSETTGSNQVRNWQLKYKEGAGDAALAATDKCDFEIWFKDADEGVATRKDAHEVVFAARLITGTTPADASAATWQEIKDGDKIVVTYWARVNQKAAVWGAEANVTDVSAVAVNDTAAAPATVTAVPSQKQYEANANGRNDNYTVLTYGAKSYTKWDRASVTDYSFDVTKTSAEKTNGLTTAGDYPLLDGATFNLFKASTTSTGANDKTFTPTGGTELHYDSTKALRFEEGPASDTVVVDAVLDTADTNYTATHTMYRFRGDETSEFTVVDLKSQGNKALHLYGLEAGTYVLVETKAPTGFNKLANPIVVTITGDTDSDGLIQSDADYNKVNGAEVSAGTAGYDADEGTITIVRSPNDGSAAANNTSSNAAWKSTVDKSGTPVKYVSTNNGGVHVVNQTGQELPSTGGIGTTIFYVAGTVLVVGAAVMLVAKRRMGAEA